MISEKIALQQPFAYHAHDNTILEVENVPLKHNLQRSVSFHVRSYEIVGIAGVQGNGQEELFDILVGRIRPTVGRILFQGKSLLGLTVSDRRKTGMSFIPSDRIRDGLALDRSVYDNCIMGHHKSLGTILLRKKLAMRLVSEISNEYKIKGGETPLQRVISLSGGNMQKIIVGREIATHPTLLVAFNPTSGVDIAAKALIHNAIRGLAMRGNSSLIISNDMDELFSLSNRILVMYKAKIVAEFEHPNYDTRTIGLYMTGIKEDATNVRESSPQNPL
jgi:simple sugar transport system ATP-binding protein